MFKRKHILDIRVMIIGIGYLTNKKYGKHILGGDLVATNIQIPDAT